MGFGVIIRGFALLSMALVLISSWAVQSNLDVINHEKN